MTDAQLLERAVALSRVERLRQLVDPNHPDYDPRYWATVSRLARQTEGKRVASPNRGTQARGLLAEWKRLDVLVNECPSRGCKTGCGNAECRAGKGDQGGGTIASITRCRQCVSDPVQPSAPVPSPPVPAATPPPVPASSTGAALEVAVVIICHGSSRFLAEAIESVLSQTRPAQDTLVVGDGSADDAAGVASQYRFQGVRYLGVDTQSWIEARKGGFEATQGDALVWLDADDTLPPDYLELGVPLLEDRRIGFVYSDVQEFGNADRCHRFPDFDPGLLERFDFIHSGAIVLRQALEISRALDQPPGTAASSNWRLWRQIVDAGFTAAKSPAVYRRRGQSPKSDEVLPYFERAGLANEEVTVVVPLSGRDAAWESHLRPWLDSQTWPRSQVRLVLADTSGCEDLRTEVRAWAQDADYPDVRIFRQDTGTDTDAAASALTRMARELHTAYGLIVGDGYRLPPDAVERLLRRMDEKTAFVRGTYECRVPLPEFIVRSYRCLGAFQTVIWPLNGLRFGAVLLRRSWLVGQRPSETFTARRGEQFPYDIGFSQRVAAQGGIWKLARDVLSDHFGAPPLPPMVPTAPLLVSVPPPREATPDRSPSQVETEALAIVAECPHASPAESRPSFLNCGPGGRRAGGQAHARDCRHCLSTSRQALGIPAGL
ncbi:MAG: glycosyltransferase family A protein [Isosphaeraceae bacterium]|nr:glycosyltransferase family A protein [Isosphaeraceae bacterium]